MIELTTKMQEQFAKMCATGKLFKSKMTGREVWNMYLDSFLDGNDPIFRDPESTSHNCNHCNNFIRRYGNVVAINSDLEIMTLFDIEIESGNEYLESFLNIATELGNSGVENIFYETFNELNSLPYEQCSKTNEVFRLGFEKNHKRYTQAEADAFPGTVNKGDTKTFNHFYLDLPKQFVDMGRGSIESIQATHRSNKEVFQRAMVEIPLDTLDLVIDLINQGSLLDGTTHLQKVILMKKFKEDYNQVVEQDLWCWIASHKLGIAKFKNELIGVLCSELAEGKDINEACKAWNYRVDPANYMKAVAPITET